VIGCQHHSGDSKRGESRGETAETAPKKMREQDNNQNKTEAARDGFE
jgi:hypothetical protein